MSTFIVDQQKSLRYLLLISFSMLASVVVLAATPKWQGPYVGAYLGGGLGNHHASTNVGTVTNTSYFLTSADINAVNNAGTSVKNPISAIAGIQAGHDWVRKHMVYGIAFDYSLLSLSSSKDVNNVTYPDNSDTYSVHTSMRTNWLFTLRGRLGHQTILHWPKSWPSLLYITGGMAIAQLKVNNNFSDSSPYAGAGGSSPSKNEIGWTAGTGIELASFDHASVVLEYLYVNMPSIKTTSYISNTAGGFGIPIQSQTSPFSTTGHFHTNLLKIGFNYRFDE